MRESGILRSFASLRMTPNPRRDLQGSEGPGWVVAAGLIIGPHPAQIPRPTGVILSREDGEGPPPRKSVAGFFAVFAAQNDT